MSRRKVRLDQTSWVYAPRMNLEQYDTHNK